MDDKNLNNDEGVLDSTAEDVELENVKQKPNNNTFNKLNNFNPQNNKVNLKNNEKSPKNINDFKKVAPNQLGKNVLDKNLIEKIICTIIGRHLFSSFVPIVIFVVHIDIHWIFAGADEFCHFIHTVGCINTAGRSGNFAAVEIKTFAVFGVGAKIVRFKPDPIIPP